MATVFGFRNSLKFGCTRGAGGRLLLSDKAAVLHKLRALRGVYAQAALPIGIARSRGGFVGLPSMVWQVGRAPDPEEGGQALWRGDRALVSSSRSGLFFSHEQHAKVFNCSKKDDYGGADHAHHEHHFQGANRQGKQHGECPNPPCLANQKGHKKVVKFTGYFGGGSEGNTGPRGSLPLRDRRGVECSLTE